MEVLLVCERGLRGLLRHRLERPDACSLHAFRYSCMTDVRSHDTYALLKAWYLKWENQAGNHGELIYLFYTVY